MVEFQKMYLDYSIQTYTMSWTVIEDCMVMAKDTIPCHCVWL